MNFPLFSPCGQTTLRKHTMSSSLVISDVDKLTYRQLQLELKSRKLKAAGKSGVLRARLRRWLLAQNDDEFDFDECSICLEKLSFDRRTTVITACAHPYHRICLKKWIKTTGESSMSCPLCRSSLLHDEQLVQGRNTKISLWRIPPPFPFPL